MRSACASAPGKVILFGEHFVVYDKPALVSSIDLRAYVEAMEIDQGFHLEGWSGDNPALRASRYVAERLGYGRGIKLRTRSEIPQSVGLGSSASISVASAAATSLMIGKPLDLDLIMEAAHQGEKLIHYKPSGIDTAIASLGGAGVYRRSEGFRRLSFKLQDIIIVNTGKMRRTGDLVKKVKDLRDSNPKMFARILEDAESLIQEALEALRSPDIERIGILMRRNQELLRSIGVSSREIEDAIKLCMKAGALGAKLTGAGGGGCIIAVAEDEKIPKIIDEVKRFFQAMRSRLMVEGVRSEPSI